MSALAAYNYHRTRIGVRGNLQRVPSRISYEIREAGDKSWTKTPWGKRALLTVMQLRHVHRPSTWIQSWRSAASCAAMAAEGSWPLLDACAPAPDLCVSDCWASRAASSSARVVETTAFVRAVRPRRRPDATGNRRKQD